eukprot:TRINITY_DN3230_c0_g5_i1.p1 TRINITY_DN3230_c0_g5~~TRINITY_DN3230_c0_g5_i1.p1  ORF type:complete len:400 (-),score=88.67 TRINITY_DN3230_c0_g5_i1:781-1980(-)
MNIATWTRDSHGLFDYESNEIVKKMLVTRSRRFLIRVNETGEVRLASEAEMGSMDATKATLLFRISPAPQPGYFHIENSASVDQEAENCVWLALRGMRADGRPELYKLKRGDVVKIGKMHMKIRDYQVEGEDKEGERVSREADEESVNVMAFNDQPKDENDLCRICFCEEDSKGDPLLSLCKCTGTMKFLHYNCLKSWIDLKLETKQSASLIEYSWKSFECEICRTPYPYSISHIGVRYSLTNIVRPGGSFITLESVSTGQDSPRFVNVVKFSEAANSFRIGRGHNADMKIMDISVSRLHALLWRTSEGIFLQDNASKFGTLVLTDKLELRPGIERAVQVGKTLVSFEVKQPTIQAYTLTHPRSLFTGFLTRELPTIEREISFTFGEVAKELASKYKID